MKKYLFLLIALGLAACETAQNGIDSIDTNVNLEDDVITGEELISFLDAQKGEFDDIEFVEALTNKGLMQRYHLQNIDIISPDLLTEMLKNIYGSEYTTKFVFSPDGTCYHYYRELAKGGYDESFMEEDGYIYMTSEPLKWNYDAEKNCLTTVDQYGNTSTSVILYFDGEKAYYSGAIGRESQWLSYSKDVNNGEYIESNYGLLEMVDDRSCWSCDKPRSMEAMRWFNIEAGDAHAHMIEQVTATTNEIDDDAFLDKLYNSAINLCPDTSVVEDGCSYHKTYVYSVKDDFMIWSLPQTILNHLVVFMEDNTARCCSTYYNYKLFSSIAEQKDCYELDDKVYASLEWRYDADTNTIFSCNDKAQAEVIYFDGDIAILRGSLFGGIALSFPMNSDYDYFIFDFNREDRAKVMEEYPIDITEWI